MGEAPHPSFKGKALGTRLRPTPSLPGYCGAFARLVIPVGGAFANLALPGGRAFANPGANPELLTRTRFPIEIYTTQRILLEKKKQICSFVKDGKKLKSFVKACSRLFACISSLLITPELDCEHGSEAIDANQRFLVIESSFSWYYLKNILSYLPAQGFRPKGEIPRRHSSNSRVY